MNPRDASDVVGSMRRRAWTAGGVVLLALGVGTLALPIGSLVLNDGGAGGVAFLPLAVPPLVAGYCVLRQLRWARLFGCAVAAIYGLVVAYIATTPWRGLTPAPGQSSPPLDPGTVLVAVGFLTSAALIALGKADRRLSG